MKINYCATLICMLLVFFGGAEIQAQSSVENISWLAGCWAGKANGREFTEQWMKPAGDTMLGMGRTVAKGKTVDFEFMQIRQEQPGDIYFVAKPSGQQEASFKLVTTNARELIFENPTHDFPQRVIYRLKDDDSLLASIEGVMGAKKKTIEVPMKRDRCEAGR